MTTEHGYTSSRWRHYLSMIVAAFIVALPAMGLTALHSSRQLENFDVVVDLSATNPTKAQLYWDTGQGFSEAQSRYGVIRDVAGTQQIRFRIGAGTFDNFRFDFSTNGGRYSVFDMRIEHDGRFFAPLPFETLKPIHQIKSFSIKDGTGVFVVNDGDTDPYAYLELKTPLALYGKSLPVVRDVLIYAIGEWLLAFALVAGLTSACRRSTWSLTPVRLGLAILLPILGVVISSYPIIFAGKSRTSPQIGGVALLYPTPPYLPGGSVAEPTSARSADVGAFAWYSQPVTMAEKRALDQGEWPLWNRYDYGGLPLLGQGISQFGDPLHWIAVFGDSSSVAWDVKFLAAKLIFALSIFAIVAMTTGSMGVAAVVSFSSSFIGLFMFRINHPAYFTFCYSPLILLAWILVTGAVRRRTHVAAVAAFAASTFCVVNSGAIKEAVASLIILHLTGLLYLLINSRRGESRVSRLSVAALACVGSLVVLYPVLGGFLETLSSARTLSDVAQARTLPLTLFGGLFDEFMYFRLSLQRFPSMNLFLALGFCWAAARLASLVRDPRFQALALGFLAAVSVAFGVIPNAVLIHVPFIGQIGHLHDVFLLPVVVLGIALSAFGLERMLSDSGSRRWYRDYAVAAAIMLAVTTTALLTYPNVEQIEPGLPNSDGLDPHIPWIIAGFVLLALALPPLASAVRRRRSAVAAALIGVIVFALHARYADNLETGYRSIDAYFMIPGPRPDYAEPSKAMTWVRQRTDAVPARSVGMNGSFFPGYGATVGIEQINGPEPLQPARMIELIVALNVPLNWGWVMSFDGDSVPRTKGFLDLMGVQWVVDMPGATSVLAGAERRLRADLDVYERRSAWPRAFFVDRVERYQSLSELAARIERSTEPPFAALSADLPLPTDLPTGDGTDRVVIPASDYRLTGNATAFHVDASGPGLVVLDETWAPGLVASINGDRRQVVPVNHVLRGIVIDRAGPYDISVAFDPDYGRRAPFAIAIGVALLLLACFWPLRRRGAVATGAAGLAG